MTLFYEGFPTPPPAWLLTESRAQHHRVFVRAAPFSTGAVRFHRYNPVMSLACLFGAHRPSVVSIAKRPQGLVALCDGCGRPLEKVGTDRWLPSPPLDPISAARR
jgi:hypothetical protein